MASTCRGSEEPLAEDGCLAEEERHVVDRMYRVDLELKLSGRFGLVKGWSALDRLYLNVVVCGWMEDDGG